ncbi:MAG: hypothetical protein WDN31_12220 [Hyphomicrobium sp.]
MPCKAFGVPNPQQLAERAERLAEHNRIDPIADVKSDRIYLFTGTNDHTVVRPIVAAARRFYEDLGVPAGEHPLRLQTCRPDTPSSPTTGARAATTRASPTSSTATTTSEGGGRC